MSKKNSKKSQEKNGLRVATEQKLVELIISFDPTMDPKKIRKRAKRAAKILVRGVKAPVVPEEAKGE